MKLHELLSTLNRTHRVLTNLVCHPFTNNYLSTVAPAGTKDEILTTIAQVNAAIEVLKVKGLDLMTTYTVVVDGFRHDALYGPVGLMQVIETLQSSYPGRVIAVQTVPGTSGMEITVLAPLKNDPEPKVTLTP